MPKPGGGIAPRRPTVLKALSSCAPPPSIPERRKSAGQVSKLLGWDAGCGRRDGAAVPSWGPWPGGAPRPACAPPRSARSRLRGGGCPAPAGAGPPVWGTVAAAGPGAAPVTARHSFRVPSPQRLLPRTQRNVCTFHRLLHHLVVAIHGGRGPCPARGCAAASRPSGCSGGWARAGAEPCEFGGGGGRGGAVGAGSHCLPLQPFQFFGLRRLLPQPSPRPSPTCPFPPRLRGAAEAAAAATFSCNTPSLLASS